MFVVGTQGSAISMPKTDFLLNPKFYVPSVFGLLGFRVCFVIITSHLLVIFGQYLAVVGDVLYRNDICYSLAVAGEWQAQQVLVRTPTRQKRKVGNKKHRFVLFLNQSILLDDLIAKIRRFHVLNGSVGQFIAVQVSDGRAIISVSDRTRFPLKIDNNAVGQEFGRQVYQMDIGPGRGKIVAPLAVPVFKNFREYWRRIVFHIDNLEPNTTLVVFHATHYLFSLIDKTIEECELETERF